MCGALALALMCRSAALAQSQSNRRSRSRSLSRSPGRCRRSSSSLSRRSKRRRKCIQPNSSKRRSRSRSRSLKSSSALDSARLCSRQCTLLSKHACCMLIQARAHTLSCTPSRWRSSSRADAKRQSRCLCLRRRPLPLTSNGEIRHEIHHEIRHDIPWADMSSSFSYSPFPSYSSVSSSATSSSPPSPCPPSSREGPVCLV